MAISRRANRRGLSRAEIDTYIAQLQSPENARVEDIARTCGRELRSRYFNPAWIEAMNASGYDGARHMADFADNLLLWDVTSPEHRERCRLERVA